MPQTIDRDGARTRATRGRRRHRGPVLLATFESAPLDARAIRLAVESAAEIRCTLTVADVVEIKPGRRGAIAIGHAVPPAQVADVRAIAALAGEVGVEVRLVRVPSLRLVAALLGLVAEHRPALVVFGPDPTRLRRFRTPTRRQYRRHVAALVDRTPCLLWTAVDQLATAVAPAAETRRAVERRARS